jgi:hypothetical protein
MQIISMFVYERIEYWKSVFEIAEWNIVCEAIDEMQVVDIWEESTPGHEFVGIHSDFETKTATLYYTRPLEEDDIIHELLHVRYPEWSEEKVTFWTSLLNGEQVMKQENAMEYLLPTG